MVTSVRMGRTVRLNTLRSMPRYPGASRRRMKRGGNTMLALRSVATGQGGRVVIRMSRPTKSLRLNASVMINRYCVQILIPCRDIDVKLGPALALNLDEPVTTETAIDARGQLRTFHGGNRGSNPRGDCARLSLGKGSPMS